MWTPEAIETHIAVVMLLGDRDVKVKKPAALGFRSPHDINAANHQIGGAGV
ncbi:MAG TPA: hypothetical protein VGD67_17710 [Pseudonocardiaceae bacterium]